MKDNRPVLDYGALFANPLTWSIVLLSLSAVLYISAVFLTWYANSAGDKEATSLLRRYALFWAVPLVFSVIGIMVELRRHNTEHFDRMVDFWYLFAISAVMFVITIGCISVRRNYGLAVWLLIGQFVFAFFGYGISHYPYLLYPYLTIYDSFTNQAMAVSLVVAFVLGLLLLLPSLYLVLKLFLFDKDYVRGKGDHHA